MELRPAGSDSALLAGNITEMKAVNAEMLSKFALVTRLKNTDCIPRSERAYYNSFAYLKHNEVHISEFNFGALVLKG